ncbi:protein kinase PINOID 2 [Senna tora]|uniref:non-specific serine/threonine protein kinase n=1 Tax=Senna tora TaxID=362788 RepID=A0A834X5N6_9FABA|nr:protein kinase PINOID 2 [Senna tora]
MASTIVTPRDESDNDSFSSRNHHHHRSSSSSHSACSSATAATTTSSRSTHKPHKAANEDAAWEAMRRLRLRKGPHPVGLEDFRVVRRLGGGDMGNVYLCRIRKAAPAARGYGDDDDDEHVYYAMKVVDREAVAMRNKLKRAEMEKEILSIVDHPFLPTLYAEFEASHFSCYLMEFCPGGDLYAARLRQPGSRFSVSSAKFYAAEIVVALEYLHMMGIVYRDLKPENVLVRHDGHIMLSDFDLSLKTDVVPKLLLTPKTTSSSPSPPPSSSPLLSCFSTKPRRHKTTPSSSSSSAVVVVVAEPTSTTTRSKSLVGTHEYLAPEVISGEGHGGEVDWWTLGVLLYELLYGITPFKGETNERTLRNIMKQPVRFPKTKMKERDDREEMKVVEDLIRKLLVKNPKKRMGSWMGAAEIKRHEFFEGVNWALIRWAGPPEVPPSGNYCRGFDLKKKGNSGVLVPKGRKEKERGNNNEAFRITSGGGHYHHFDYF